MIASLLVDEERFPLDEAAGRAYRDRFARDHYVRFPHFFTARGFALLCAEAERLGQISIRRDFAMVESGGTPRRMSTLGGDRVACYSTLIPALYRDEGLLAFLAGVAGEPVYEVPDPVENHVLNILHQVGDVHGGHVDTYAFAFNIFIEAPPEDGGGALEFVPGSTRLEDLEGPAARRVFHRPGDCYLLKTDAAIHRVKPLTRPGRRTIINMAYANPATVDLRSYSTSVLYGSPEEGPAEEPPGMEAALAAVRSASAAAATGRKGEIDARQT